MVWGIGETNLYFNLNKKKEEKKKKKIKQPINREGPIEIGFA